MFTALASYLDARYHRGRWLLRIDDSDSPRNKAGSVADILNCLETFGLLWDGEIAYQSQNHKSYDYYLTKLAKSGATYRCVCSRKSLAGQPDVSGSVYSGICRRQQIPMDAPSALRLKTFPDKLSFHDSLQGLICSDIAKQHGDFILKRKDGIIAYQFAVVIDDLLQGINHVVRGGDLLLETPKQIYLQTLLGIRPPDYMHVPILIDKAGNKLSKQTLATAVDLKNPRQTLFDMLLLLKQNPPDAIKVLPVGEQLAWAVAHWQPERLKFCSKISIEGENR